MSAFGAATFSDSEDDEVSQKVALRVHENTNQFYRAFTTFMDTPEYINPSGDPSTNIVDRGISKCYKIPDHKIPKFFKFLESCRRGNIRQLKYEKQLEFSGIMIDFDIKQTTADRIVSDSHRHLLCVRVLTKLVDHLEIVEKKLNITCGFTTKPKPVLIDEHIEGQYKDGFHMIIPGVQVSREFKKFLIWELTGDMGDIFHDIPIVDDGEFTVEKILDTNSAHVGVHFIGNATKHNSPAYQLTDIYRNEVVIRDGGVDIIPAKTTFPEDANLCYEFSINWQRDPAKGGIIEKRRYFPKASSRPKIDAYQAPVREVEEEFNQQYNKLSILNIHDPDADFVRQLLDILHPDRYNEYGAWFKVLCALAHTSIEYEPLAEYFSRKSEKYSDADFANVWAEALKRGNSNLSIGSIHYWARQDNEARYFEVKKRDVHTMLYEMVYSLENEGCLEHYDIAKLFHRMMKGKFVFSMADGVHIGSWFEYILEEDPKKQGELFKWRKFVRQRPTSMSTYISETMPVMFRSVLGKIKAKYEESEGGLAKYHAQVYKNFRRTCGQLKNSGFKKGAMAEAETLFYRIGFADMLDKDPELLGVGNGILKLGKTTELLVGVHGYHVSRFTPVNWIPYNPYNPTTHKVMKVLRSLFTDAEPDTFNWLMHYLASSLDGKIKDSIFVLATGGGSNGKTMLTEMHKAAIGKMYSAKMPMEFLTKESRNADSATPALMQLRTARFVYYSESERGSRLNQSRLKEVTGQETLAGRNLNEDMVNFKPTCHHLAGTNYEFEIQGTDHGIWRRIIYMRMKIRFVDTSQEKIDPTNPLEREADLSIGKEWVDDPEVLASYLSILTHYYESLMRNYGGKLMKVPHPNIKRDTMMFRAKQDKISQFLGIYLVVTSDDVECTIDEMAKKYVMWHRSKYPDNKSFQYGLIEQLANSLVAKLWRTRGRTKYIVGHRVLDLGEEKEEHEKFFSVAQVTYKVNVEPESVDEYYNRMCREFDAKKYVPINIKQHPSVSPAARAAEARAAEDSDIEEEMKMAEVDTSVPNNFKYEAQVNLEDRKAMISMMALDSDAESDESEDDDASESES